MRLYLAGPMQGIEDYNYPAFEAATGRLRYAGYEVLSPHEKESESDGVTDEDKETWAVSKPQAYVLDNCEHVMECDAVALLPGWHKSLGTRMELAVAERLSVPYAPYLLWYYVALDNPDGFILDHIKKGLL